MLMAPSETKLQRLAPQFHKSISVMHDRLEELLSAKPFTMMDKPRGLDKVKAVYLFSDGDYPFYVGRTQNLGRRLSQHCNEGSAHNQSSVAFKLACRDLKIKRQKYKKGSTPAALLRDHVDLKPAFQAWKDCMKKMSIRWVEEGDPVTQTLLEIYCSVALNTPHNDFATH